MMDDRVQYALTTSDNPYDPFTQYEEWNAFDESRGYYTAALLARVAVTSEELSDVDQDQALDDAISEILWMNDNGLYIRVQLGQVRSG